MSRLFRKKTPKEPGQKMKTPNDQGKISHESNKDQIGKTDMPAVRVCWVFALRSFNKPAQR